MSGEEEEELCEYERRRLAHMRENRDLMRTLGEWENILCSFVFVDTYCRVFLLSLKPSLLVHS